MTRMTSPRVLNSTENPENHICDISSKFTFSLPNNFIKISKITRSTICLLERVFQILASFDHSCNTYAEKQLQFRPRDAK